MRGGREPTGTDVLNNKNVISLGDFEVIDQVFLGLLEDVARQLRSMRMLSIRLTHH